MVEENLKNCFSILKPVIMIMCKIAKSCFSMLKCVIIKMYGVILCLLSSAKKYIMKLPKKKHGALIICCAVSIILLGVFVILQANSSKVMEMGTQWLFVAGVPLLIALIVGGYITKFKGFGIELESKLNTPIRTLSLKATDAIVSLPETEKQSERYLESLTQDQINRTKRLSFIANKRDYYNTYHVEMYLRKLHHLEYLEVKRENEEFVCLIPIKELNIDEINDVSFGIEQIDKFINALRENKVVSTYRHVCIDLTVRQDEGLISVLEKLRNANRKDVVVVDSERKFVGLLTASEIERRIADDVLYSRKT